MNWYDGSPARLWTVAGATAAGDSHLRYGIPNQDAYDYRYCGGRQRAVILAVADGAGSAPRSGEGSRLAASVSVATAARGFNRYQRIAGLQPAVGDGRRWHLAILRQAIGKARATIVQRSQEDGGAPQDFATTLLVALATPRRIFAAQIGDGAILAFNTRTGQARTLCDSHNGRYANETLFITTHNGIIRNIAHTGRGNVGDYNGIGLITDGLENLALKMPGRQPHVPFWGPMFCSLLEDGAEVTGQRLDDFVASDRVRSRTSDDLTILISVVGAGNPEAR